MFIHYRTQGIIIKKEAQGEVDQLFTIYTKDFGKLEILGKAIRKISSKLRSGAELFYLSEIEFIQGKTYKTLTDAILIEKFENLRNDLKKLSIAYKISEVFDSLIKGQEPDETIWKLLNETFDRLNHWKIENSLKIENWKLEIIYYYFLWNLFSILGYQPELYQCSFCQKKLVPERLYFSPKEGGVICQHCSSKLKSKEEINPEVVKILRIILKRNWSILKKLKIDFKTEKLLKGISDFYFSYIQS
jgi:DNA repair protein RecO (recombination protein O)